MRRCGETRGAGYRGLVLLLALCLAALVPSRAVAGTAELVMFEDAGCSWCRRFLQEIGPIYSRTEEGQRAPLRRLDISEAPRSGLRLAQRVSVTPTFVLVEGGTEVGRITGYPGQDFFWGLLGELMGRLPSMAPPVRALRDAAIPGGALSPLPVGPRSVARAAAIAGRR